jgi:hypothetical protein
MKTVTVLQKPIADMPEYDTIVTRNVPEIHDLKDWPSEFKRLATMYLSVDPELLVEHIAICSTPPTLGGLKPTWEIQQVINRLHNVFGTTYIVS